MLNIVSLQDITQLDKLSSSDDMAAYLNLFYPELVSELLEFITIYTDDELIQEIVNLLNLNTTLVVNSTNHGQEIVGYISSGDAA